MTEKAVPSVSVIIPVLNEGKVLPIALKSLHGLSVDEVFFVDGGSTDETRQLIEQAGYPCLESEPGRAKQMNRGAKEAISDILLFLHVDTIITSSNISNIKKTYNNGYCAGRFDISFGDCDVSYKFLSAFINLRSRLSKISTGDQAIFINRTTFLAIGGYPDIPLMEDVAISKRLRKHCKLAALKDKVVTSNRRWRQNGFIRTILLMWKLRFLYWLGVTPEKLKLKYQDSR